MKATTADDKKINSLQALRALAFLCIFLGHARVNVSFGTSLAVSVFFAMSGFLLTYRYEKKNLPASFQNNIRFALKKILKLYPLHFITMICSLILCTGIVIYMMMKDGSMNYTSFIWLAGYVVLHIFLVQTWIPYHGINVSLNGVAWYLSVMLFLYFVFPWIKGIVERYKKTTLCIMCMIILVVEILTCVPFLKYVGYSSPIYIWYMYCFPIFRMGDFFAGCVLKRLVFDNDELGTGIMKGTACEFFVIFITALVFSWLGKGQTNLLLLAMHNCTTLFIPLAMLWVGVFAINSGLLTKLLSNPILIWIGNISTYAFLIHHVVIQYFYYLAAYFDIEESGVVKVILVLSELSISLILSVLYKRIHDKYLRKKEKNISDRLCLL